MKVIGIVVEYNPFHNGHIYQIKKIKEMYPDSIIIVAMSGYFTERGEISVLSKWDKTKIALENGIDIILEIPFIFSIQSADTFSYAALKLLSTFKIDTLVFGSESNDLELLINTAKVQINNPNFDELIKKHINSGENYPTSLARTINELTGSCVNESNDILAVSYIKEILKNNLNINIVPIKRTNNFNDLDLDDTIVSASNIRKRFNAGEKIDKYVPKDVLNCYKKIDYDLFFTLLKYKIISEKDYLNKYHLIDEGINNRIYKSALISNNIDELIENIKTKRYTYNKINRILINIFIGITKENASKFKSLEYIRVLGLSKKGQVYYSNNKKDFDLPVITKFEKYDMLNLELKTTTLYSMLIHDNNLVNEEIKKHVIRADSTKI